MSSKDTMICAFEFGGLSLKKDLNWRVNLLAKMIVPKSSVVYKVELDFNAEPFERRVQEVNEAIEKSKKTPRLMDEMDKEALADLKEELKGAEKHLLEMAEKCPTIPFDGLVEQIKYDRMKGVTILSFRISDEVAREMADSVENFRFYQLKLTPSAV